MIELDPDFIKAIILSKFEEDWIKTVIARVLKEKIVDTRRTRITKAHLELCLGELKF